MAVLCKVLNEINGGILLVWNYIWRIEQSAEFVTGILLPNLCIFDF